MLSFQESRDQAENEGVFIGGWSFKHVLTPEKLEGKHNSSFDRANVMTTAQDWDDAEERRLVRKLDFRVLLPCCIIYFLAYLDRANLGNVKILQKGKEDSLEESLHLHGTQFNWAVSVTYFSVTALLIPSCLLVKKYSAKNFFPIVMVLWGTIVMSISSVKSATGLFSARFFLGIPESGVVPACIFYFSLWYKPVERAWRIGVFHSSNALAGAVSGLIALGIDNIDGSHGLKSWQWVFIIEGALPIAMAPVIYFLLLTFPENSTALSERERYIAINRFGRGATRKTDVTWEWSAFFRIMTRPSTYLFFTSYVCLTIIAVAQATFLPTILSVFAKFSTSKSNLYTAAVNFVAIPLYWVWPFHSDWTRERMWHYIIPVLCAVPCYGLWTYKSTHPDNTSITAIQLYGMAFLGNMVVIAQPVALSYRSSTLYGAAEQATGSAAIVSALSIASIIAPQVYPNKDAPRYLAGFEATCALIGVCILSYLTIPWLLLQESKGRKAKTGHHMPLRAMEDAEHSMVSAAALERIHQLNELEEKEAVQRRMAAKGIEMAEIEDAGAKV